MRRLPRRPQSVRPHGAPRERGPRALLGRRGLDECGDGLGTGNPRGRRDRYRRSQARRAALPPQPVHGLGCARGTRSRLARDNGEDERPCRRSARRAVRRRSDCVSQTEGGFAASGVWPSPISARQAAAGRLRLSDVQLDGSDAYWVEGRPTEGGRCVIVRDRDGVSTDLIAAPFSARTGVHEYGGAAMCVQTGTVYFANASDRRLYRIIDGEPETVTEDVGDLRNANLEIDASRARIVCVAEDHRGASVVNDIRVIPLAGGEAVSIVAGNDFYSTPRVSPDGASLTWLTWHFPNMPWDGGGLWGAELDDAGIPQHPRLVAGGTRESIFQPSWSADSVLHFSSDRTGWWNLYRFDGEAVVPLAPMDAECGGPQWVFGLSTYAHCGGGRIALWACRDGEWEFHVLDAGGKLT